MPSRINNLIDLLDFTCHNNKLTILPKEIGDFINLQHFHCSYNNLTTLPPVIVHK